MERVRICDGDTGEIYYNSVLDLARALVIARHHGWTVLGLDGDDIMVRAWDAYKGKPHSYASVVQN